MELRMRAITSLEIGMEAPERSAIADKGVGGRICCRRPAIVLRAAGANPFRRAHHRRRNQSGGGAVPRRGGQLRFADRFAQPGKLHGLRLCSRRAHWSAHRQLPILAISDADNQCAALTWARNRRQRLSPASVDKNELLARARTQIRKRRYTDHLRDNVQNSIEMAITDALTGCITAATWKAISRRWPSKPRAAASRWR